MHGCYKMSLLGAKCKLLADLPTVRNAAILLRRSGSVLAECPEWDDYITFMQGRAHPCKRECCGTGGELCKACCH